MNKNIQMPVEFLKEVTKLLKALESENIGEDTQDIAKRIQTLLTAKLDAMEKRETFTAYKTASDETTREEKRKEYLQKAEIHKSFISDKEIPYYD